MKIKKHIKDNKILLGALCIFIILQPFLDVLPLFDNEKYFIFGFTIPTLVRCAFIGVIGLASLKYIDKKNFKYLIIYIIILMIYTLLHHNIASDNNMIIPSNYSYSLISEMFYIVRMLLPIAIINITKNSYITEKKFLKVISISAGIIGTIIFIGNTLEFSYISYGDGITKTNWVTWFFGDLSNYEFMDLTSKGWFYMANQVSGLSILLLPFCIFATLKNSNFLNIYSTIILIIGMIMLGTRVASYGWILIIFCFLVAITISKFVYMDKRTKSNYYLKLFLISFVGFIFLINSPIVKREYGYDLGDVDSLEERPKMDYNDDDNLKMVYKYIENSYEIFGIQKEYIYDRYNYKFDPNFWFKVFDLSLEKGVIENRQMQRLISNRIIEKNNYNLRYQLFGYSFSRMRNGQIYMEHDLLVQLFTMGYIGTILLIGPYLGIVCLICFRIIKKMKNKLALFNLVFVISISASIGTSVLTGHILDELFVTIYIGFICGYFLAKIERKRDKLYED